MLRTDRGLVFFFTIIFGIRVSFEEKNCYWINDWMGIWGTVKTGILEKDVWFMQAVKSVFDQ
jgi:hypothetical protein